MGLNKIYPKCAVEGCGRSIIWEQTYNKQPLCPQCTRIMLVYVWLMNNSKTMFKEEPKNLSFKMNETGNINLQ